MMSRSRQAAVVLISVVLLGTLLGCSTSPQPYPVVSVNIEHATTGQMPAGCSAALTGGGGPVSWAVINDPTGPYVRKVLAQTSTDTTPHRFPLCVFNGVTAKDVEASVWFKAVSGQVDQAAGLIVRYLDKDNYYVVRANALENNIRLYKVLAGKRIQFAGADVKVKSGQWYVLTVSVQGPHFQAFYESWDERLEVSHVAKPLFEADDATFPGAGRVGLWTKADSVTYFDHITIRNLDAKHDW